MTMRENHTFCATEEKRSNIYGFDFPMGVTESQSGAQQTVGKQEVWAALSVCSQGYHGCLSRLTPHPSTLVHHSELSLSPQHPHDLSDLPTHTLTQSPLSNCIFFTLAPCLTHSYPVAHSFFNQTHWRTFLFHKDTQTHTHTKNI